ncbi:MAG: dihydroorotase [Alphaproteobacteria bacterium]|nr:dihydroorotase [Alphaproteobacteria bacterium]
MKPVAPLHIKGGSLVMSSSNTCGDLLISGDRIAAVGSVDAPEGAEVLDASGYHVAPGIVDLGVFSVDKRACIAGGITRIGLMPDLNPPLDDPGLVQRAALAAKPDLWVHPIAAATKGLRGEELAEAGLMRKAGAKAVSTGRGWIADSGVMLRVLIYARTLGLTVISHAEDAGLTRHAVATSGETATRLGLASAPASAEAMAVARDIALVRESGAALHFRQVTTASGFELVRAAKAEGLPVTCGITPAHLLLCDHDVSDYRSYARLSPPLRSAKNVEAAREALADGTIDVLCSGHDPRGPEAKRLPFADAEPGMAGAETLLALGLGFVRDGLIDLPRLFTLLSTNPSRVLGVDSGTLTADAPADILLFDLEAPWQIRGAAFRAQAGNTPFEGLPVQGKVVATLKGGRTLS